MSQEGLGLEADVDRTYVGAVERGEQNPSFENVRQLLSALGVMWEEFGRALDAEPVLRQRPHTRTDTQRNRPARRPVP